MGILKPWAPPRSYGLVIRLDADGQPLYSLHSRVDGDNHGVVAAVECDGALVRARQGAGPHAARCRSPMLEQESARMTRHRSSSCARPPSSMPACPRSKDVDFTSRRGEIHALLGENGAGKSTLTKVMAGVVTLTSGTMLIDGVEVAPQTPLEARHPASPWCSRRPAWCRR